MDEDVNTVHVTTYILSDVRFLDANSSESAGFLSQLSC